MDRVNEYVFIKTVNANIASDSALSTLMISPSDLLDVSHAQDRTKIFSLLETAITNLGTSLNIIFSETREVR